LDNRFIRKLGPDFFNGGEERPFILLWSVERIGTHEGKGYISNV